MADAELRQFGSFVGYWDKFLEFGVDFGFSNGKLTTNLPAYLYKV